MSTVLVVEDSQTQRQLISDLLKSEFTVTSACDGIEALEKLQQSYPDLVVSDIVMPRLNGYELCRRIKTDPKTSQIPVVICSSKNTDIDRYWGMRQGADAYIGKPFEPSELIATIKQLLRKQVSS